MSKIGLSKEEIKKRLIRLRNLERLHKEQKLRIGQFVSEKREFKKEIGRLKVIVSEQQRTIDDMKLQIEELRVMVFGKKKKTNDIDDDDIIPPEEKIPRSIDSYKRPIPKDEEVTEIKNHPLNHCKCGTETTKKKTVIFYEEDIPVPAKKIVRKHVVEKGYCENLVLKLGKKKKIKAPRKNMDKTIVSLRECAFFKTRKTKTAPAPSAINKPST